MFRRPHKHHAGVSHEPVQIREHHGRSHPVPAIGDAFKKLDPSSLAKNPVMFVVAVVSALTTVLFVKDLATGGANLGFSFQIVIWLWFTVLFANFAEAVAEGRGKAQAESLRRTRTETQAKLLSGDDRAKYKLVPAPASRSATSCWSRPATSSLRWRSHRGRRLGQRGRDHRRIRSGHPRIRRRPLGRHRRHAGAVRLDPRAHHGGSRLDLHRPHDRAGRGCRAPEDAQRDRAQHPARRHDADLRARHRDDPELCFLCRRLYPGDRAGRAVRDADPDHHRRAALGHRHRRHGSSGALQRARHVGPRRRGRRRRRHAAARQDRHDHARQPPGDRVPPGEGVTEQELADAAQLASLADETPEGRSIVVLAKEKYGIRARDMASCTRPSCPSPRRAG
jgi:hypothetical protein